MQVNITFRHLESTEALKAHARDKVERIQRYIDRPSEAHVVLDLENLEHKADINLKAGPFQLRGRAKSGDMYASIDAAAEKIERQLKKHKEKLKSHKLPERQNGQKIVDVRHEVLDLGRAPSDRVVKSDAFQARVMTLDEAVMQLDLLDVHFYVFQSAKDGSFNVVYHREDGKLGLLEARSA
ncbi:ribosome hibernation-promoting factor, HPF/YfiA family [Anaeromyxobacter diazotrophicus]|uniref:Ribosome hibernation promoting factor n=1 Tax=Anaeromyxobacter diazotrophicus TaxID=2590199 RepID=A0A7I9VM64_9BACT|nr:ribosome-associated translation inhibitor RaiA [Anaeromyxobacter diazotrophicus]GEJ57495.1 ribosomal subunit interface protein [Anaeromyxobacter diazotrophicus]